MGLRVAGFVCRMQNFDSPTPRWVQGQATEVEIMAKEILRTKKRINNLLVKHTGQPLERIEADTERDFWMSAEESKNLRAH